MCNFSEVDYCAQPKGRVGLELSWIVLNQVEFSWIKLNSVELNWD